MYFKQFYLGCLSHASYLIGSGGQGIVVDPQRDVEQYIDEAREAGLTIKYVIETHLHADFVSGHLELAQRTGAQIIMGHRAGATFAHIDAHDGDTFEAGSLLLRVLETPGHTPEAISVLVTDTADSKVAPKLLTGDTLFIGDVGRPDLSGSRGYTTQDMAAMLYESLHTKILPLQDDVEVYPAHGAGSLCGRNMSAETWSTLGEQRISNYALKPMSKDQFVTLMTQALPEAPRYFAADVQLNRSGAPLRGDLIPGRALSPQAVAAQAAKGALLLDVRPSEVYGPEHVPNSMNIGLDGQFASWAATMIDLAQPIIIIAETAEGVEEAVLRLGRVGFASVIGSLDGGLPAWKDAGLPVASIPQVSVHDLAHARSTKQPIQIIDVRRTPEFESGSVPEGVSVPLSELEGHIASLDRERETFVVCGSGYRSSIATSLLESAGFKNLNNVDGGMKAYSAAGLETVTHVF